MADGKAENSSAKRANTTAVSGKSAKKARLATALRNNLRRRKMPTTTPDAAALPAMEGDDGS